jgi:hypothetical protein
MSWGANTVALLNKNDQKASNLLGALQNRRVKLLIKICSNLFVWRQVSSEDIDLLIEYVLVMQTSLGFGGTTLLLER